MIFAAFNTPDSLDSLTSFYQDAFNDLGLQILTTTEASGGITWFVGTDDTASTFGGVVSVFPATDGETEIRSPSRSARPTVVARR